MRKEIVEAERRIARIAANQHGVIAYAQLIWAGLSSPSVDRRVKAGRLHRLHRGVYAVGHTNLSQEGKWLAAVLACGEGAALSHESAAHLWSLSPKSPPYAHVTVPDHGGRSKRKGIVLHRSTTITPTDVTLRRNIPVTTPARTKRDMGWATETTRSDLERKFLRLLRAHDLPIPEVNARLGPYTVDFGTDNCRPVASAPPASPTTSSTTTRPPSPPPYATSSSRPAARRTSRGSGRSHPRSCGGGPRRSGS